MSSKLLFIATILFLTIFQYSNSNPTQLKQALKYYNQDKYEQAISIYDKIINKEPKNVKAFIGRANCYLSLNEFHKAIDDMNYCLTIDTLNAQVFNILGIAKMYSDSLIYACNDFDKAIELDSTLADAFANRALLNMSYMLFSISEKDLLRAIKLEPKEGIYYNYLGFAQHHSNEYTKAIESYNKAIYHGFVNSEIYLKRANSFSKINKFHEAIADYTKSIELDSMQINALTNRAFAYSQIGDLKSAELDKARTELINNQIAKLDNDTINTELKEIFSHPSGKYSVLLPKQFNSLFIKDTFALVQMITREKIKSPQDYYGVGMIIEFIENTQDKLGISQETDLANYCRGLVTEIGQHAFLSQPQFEKQKQLPNGAFYQMAKISIQFKANTPQFIQYVVGYIKHNQLILLKFIYPEHLAFKYDNVFQQAIDSFKFD